MKTVSFVKEKRPLTVLSMAQLSRHSAGGMILITPYSLPSFATLLIYFIRFLNSSSLGLNVGASSKPNGRGFWRVAFDWLRRLTVEMELAPGSAMVADIKCKFVFSEGARGINIWWDTMIWQIKERLRLVRPGQIFLIELNTQWFRIPASYRL